MQPDLEPRQRRPHKEILIAGFLFCWLTATAQPLAYTGINLSGGEFGKVSRSKASVFGQDFTYPSIGEFGYFQSNGCNVIRLPFLWERLQPDLDRPLDVTEARRLKSVVGQATGLGIKVILDVHNYARYFGKMIAAPEVPQERFAGFWKYLADEFKADPNMMFGLMNEPHDRDVWAGFTWWSAGPWWGDYMFSVQPNAGKDAPQISYLRPHLQPR